MKQKTWNLIVMWDCLGLETIINVTQMEQDTIVDALRGRKTRHSNPLHYMIIRASANPQRFYEIYAVVSEVDEVSLRQAFHDNPQATADLVRERGEKLYSNRNTTKAVIT